MSSRYPLRRRPRSPTAVVAKDGPVSRLGELPQSATQRYVSSDLSDAEGNVPEDLAFPPGEEGMSTSVASATRTSAPHPGTERTSATRRNVDTRMERPHVSTSTDDPNDPSVRDEHDNESSENEEIYTHRQTQLRRARSLGHIEQNLTAEQLASIESATQKLTQAQKQRIDLRNESVNINTPESRGEGPSHGKGVDPRNWGGSGIPEEELDPKAQREVLDEWQVRRDLTHTRPTRVEIAPTTGKPMTEDNTTSHTRKQREQQLELAR